MASNASQPSTSTFSNPIQPFTTITTEVTIKSSGTQNSMDIWPDCHLITIKQPSAKPPQPINTYALFAGKSWWGFGRKDCWNIGAPWWDPSGTTVRKCFRDDAATISYLKKQFAIVYTNDRSDEEQDRKSTSI
jgi:hypothetical protein